MKIKMLKIGAAWCGPCASLEKVGTLKKFADRHPEISVEQHDDSDNGNKNWEKFADRWNVKSIPVLIFVGNGEELGRTLDVSITGMEKALEKAQKKAEKL